jgi:hypothetical protein
MVQQGSSIQNDTNSLQYSRGLIHFIQLLLG